MAKNTYATDFSKRQTPQSEPIPGRTSMVKNEAGGFVFPVDDWTRLHRFLVIGSEGGTYYIQEQKLTKDNAETILRCIELDPKRTVETIVDVSIAGRAPKNDPALFALALCASSDNDEAKSLALSALPKVARIGTHLFHFLEYIKAQRGWGRSLVRAVQNWYLTMPNDKLALQVVKYKQRDGWSHRDALRKSHPKTDDKAKAAIFNYAVKGELVEPWPTILEYDHLFREMEADSKLDDFPTVAKAIREHRLPREIIPTALLNKVEIWDALLYGMPIGAMVRNLGKMTSIGLTKQLSEAAYLVAKQLRNEDAIRKSRIHPIQLLSALKVYGNGKGDKGSLTWNPVPQIQDALNDAFYLSFENVEATGKRFMLGLDVSSSMTWVTCGISGLHCSEGAAAMAMVTAYSEANYAIMGFATEFVELGISKGQRLDDVVNRVYGRSFGGTDCSLPMQYALENELDVDMFCVYTDNETWAGHIHPSQALQEYRQKTGIPAKLAVIGMAGNAFTIADPDDAGMMDFVGFDTITPQIISDFAR